ncbi:MAG: ABC transporter substrate-binding protein, partial [Methyloligellaceae bacterium]
MRVLGVLVALWLAAVPLSAAQAAKTVRVAVLKFGTVSWVIDVIKHHGLDRKHGLSLDVTPLASTQATKVALQAGSTDIIVSDWLWVSRQRRTGADFALAPYSTALGAIMVPGASPIRRLADLKGRTIGVAGGPLDKSWLLLTAFARRSAGIDLIAETHQVFGAPPLLAEKARQGELDAVLNYWHYCARLEAGGFRRLVDVHAAMAGLGAEG